VSQGILPRARLEDLQSLTGINLNRTGLLADSDLLEQFDVVACYTYDWMHCSLQDGIFQVESHLFLKACEPLGVQSSHVESFLKRDSWRFPKATEQKAKQLHRVFSEYRAESSSAAQRLKGSASEMLGLYSLLRFFAETAIPSSPAISKNLASFKAVCSVIDLILKAKRRHAPFVELCNELQVALQTHLRLHCECYGDHRLKPKHHFMLDLPCQFLRLQRIIDTFVLERAHLSVKVVASNVHNTSTFEKSVLSGVVNNHTRSAAEDTCVNGLRGRQAVWESTTVADKLEFCGMNLAIDDVVFRNNFGGIIAACVRHYDAFYVVVNVLGVSKILSSTGIETLRLNRQETWPIADIIPAVAWHETADGTVVIVRA
jgi:hypothetical protein